jgi:hypothetical protein
MKPNSDVTVSFGSLVGVGYRRDRQQNQGDKPSRGGDLHERHYPRLLLQRLIRWGA